MEEEILDLVDSEGKILEIMPRSEVFKRKLKNFRVVCALVKDEQGNLLIPRRSTYKEHYPNYLACVGGCAHYGESFEQALIRETFEETGILLKKEDYTLLGFISPYEYTVNGYIAVYEIVLKNLTEIQLNHEDFSEYLIVTSEQLKKLINTGEQATVNLKKILELFY